MKTPEEIRAYKREQHKKWNALHPEYKRKYNAQWEANNKEKVNEYKRKWRHDNPDKIREIDNHHYSKNPSNKIKSVTKYYYANKDKIQKYRHEYLIKNKETIKRKKQIYYQLHKKEICARFKPAKLPSQAYRKTLEYENWRQSVYKRANYTCERCGKRGILHAHHIKPAAKFIDLRTDIDNGLCLCEKCHRTEHGNH